jgi:hypothetical protein
MESIVDRYIPEKSEYELMQEVYPFKTCHEVYQIPFEDIYSDKSYINHVCMVCKSIEMDRLEIVYRCRLCLIVMCPKCGEKNPQEDYEKTKKIQDESCGKHQISEAKASVLGVNPEDNEDIKCSTCKKEIGYIKFGDYTVAKCRNCAKDFCQFCKNKHVDAVHGPKQLIFEELQRTFCSRNSIKSVFCKQSFVGMEGDVACSNCNKFIGTIGTDYYDFKICVCIACNAKLCGSCTWDHKDKQTDLALKLAQQKYRREEAKKEVNRKQAEINRRDGPKCGSQYVIRTPHGKLARLIYCQNCRGRIYDENDFGDKKDTLLFKCSSCESFLCDTCKYHYNAEELAEKKERDNEEKELFSRKLCTNNSVFLTTARTLYGHSEENVEIKCEGGCGETIGNSEDAKDEDYNFYKCRTCGKNLCEECSGSHSSEDLKNYLTKKESEKNKYEGELISQMENRRFKVNCNGKKIDMEVKKLFPAKVNMQFKVNCAVCKKVVSDFFPGYVANDVSLCASCNDILCDDCFSKHKAPFRNDCTPKDVVQQKASILFPEDKDGRYDILCAVCKKTQEKKGKEDPNVNHCGNCDQMLCDSCTKNHTGQFFSNKGDFQQQVFLCGPTSCNMLQSQYIDQSVKCSACKNCAINNYGEYYKCDFCQKLFCESCKGKKPSLKFTKSEKNSALFTVPIKDTFNCGSDMIQIEAWKIRVSDSFDCNYKHCGERIKVSKDQKINYCNRCKRKFCKQCAGNHCTPESKEYKKFLDSKGKEVEEFRKKQKEQEQARAAYFKKKKEEEQKKRAEEMAKMAKEKEEADKKKNEEADNERKKKQEAELSNLKDEERKKKEEEIRQAEEARKKREEEEKRKQEEQRKEDERKRAEEAKLKKTCGPHTIFYVPSSMARYGRLPGDRWDKGLHWRTCAKCSYVVCSVKEDNPANQCNNCWLVLCPDHGAQHK